MPSASAATRLRTRAFARIVGPFLATVTTVLTLRLPELSAATKNLSAQPALAWMLGAQMLGRGLVNIGGTRTWRALPRAAEETDTPMTSKGDHSR